MDPYSLVLGLGFLAIGSVLGAVVSLLIPVDGKVKAGIALVCGVAAVTASSGVRQRISVHWQMRAGVARMLASTDTNERLQGYVMQRVLEDPSALKWLSSRISDHDLKAKTRDLAMQGLSTLSGEALLARAVLVRKVMDRLDTAHCAQLIRDGLDEKQLGPALSELTDQDLQSLAVLVSEAVSGQLAGKVHRTPDMALAITALTDVFLGSTEAQRRKAVATLIDLNGSSDQDVCWVGQKIFARIQDLPLGEAQTLALVLVNH